MPELWELRQMQSLPLSAKVRMSENRIREWINEFGTDGVYVSFSGGKDSTVLLHIVRSIDPDVPALFVDTGLEYPEIRQHVRRLQDEWGNIEIVRPDMRFDEVIKEYGYPVISKEISERIYYARRGSEWAIKCLQGLNPDGTYSKFKSSSVKYAYLVDAPFSVSHKCCRVMKKKPAKDYERRTRRKPILGTMTEESQLRETQWKKIGCNAFDSKRPRSAPMSFWTENDVLEYIVENNLPYASVYGDIVRDEKGHYHTTGCDRTGCIFCMFGCHLEKAPNRFQRMKETHPRQYDYCMRPVEEKGLGLREVLEYIGVEYK